MKSILIFPHFLQHGQKLIYNSRSVWLGWGTQFSMDAGMFERAVKHVVYKTKRSEL